MSVRYLTPASLGDVLFRVGPLCTGLISTSLSLAGPRYSHTLPLTSGTKAKLLDCFNVSSTPRVL